MKPYSLIHVLALNLAFGQFCFQATNNDNDYDYDQEYDHENDSKLIIIHLMGSVNETYNYLFVNTFNDGM